VIPHRGNPKFRSWGGSVCERVRNSVAIREETKENLVNGEGIEAKDKGNK